MLDPDWLIRVMKGIMKLDTMKKVPGTKSEEISDLEVHGDADLKLLKCCWKNESISLSDDEMRHLCLVLQAYCLIYPLKSTATAGSTDSCNAQTKYIIPCKLPDPSKIDMKEHMWICKCVVFYFDFKKFLPNEIYHRLICLASSKAKPKRDRCCYSSKKCIFYGLQGENLKAVKCVMEIIEKDKLKIRVT